MKTGTPLIHCITNPISVHRCADAILTVGARPIMAEHPKEVAEITQTADALLLNLGTITDVRMEAMPIALREAAKKNIPVVLDLVGVACSSLRRAFAERLLHIAVPTVIKGNFSELLACRNPEYRAAGVDAEESVDLETVEKAAASLAKQYNAIFLATGETDLITDGNRLVYLHNGTKQLSEITGTGCMLGALCASYLAADNCFDSVVDACGMLGIAGERAAMGQGAFLHRLIDILSVLTKDEIRQCLKKEEKKVET